MKFGKTAALMLAAAPALALAENDYPTLDRLNYALDCMDRHGGPKIENLTGCSCEIDVIAEQMSYEQFVDANVYIVNKDTPGDKGGVFRDMPIGKDNYAVLMKAREDAEKRCFVTVREVKRKDEADAGGEETSAAAKSGAEEAAQ
ncbi:MAG: hypothetical protein R3F45_15910 [Gammaproteobacteria bacterium]